MVGLKKGGYSTSVKIVSSVINHRQPDKLANTTLVAVCPARKDDHKPASAMPRIYLQQQELLMREGGYRWWQSASRASLRTRRLRRSVHSAWP